MSSSFADPFDLGGLGEAHSFGDGYLGSDSFSNIESAVEDSTSPIYVSGGEFTSDPAYLSSETNADEPILTPPAEMEPEEGYALREWRRQNTIRLEEKEKREKEALSQIIVAAEDFMIELHRKGQLTCETNKASNREKEKVFVASQEKFHAAAGKDYWKSIAELIPNEVPTIEKRKGKKGQDEKHSTFVIQGPKPGKPTDLARMRQILLKLKHNTPPHLKPSHPPAPDANAALKAALPVAVA
ncbi:hypothetical protein OROGR_011100 [Orobanche gracilis]